MQVACVEIDGLLLITQPVFADQRGSFTESYNKCAFSEVLPGIEFVQDNISVSKSRGTVRGMHLQIAPRAQAKLFRVLRGAVFDVSLDLREGSPTYGRHVTTRLDADKGTAIFLPTGFAHGFCTLEDDTRVQYKLGDYFSPSHCRTIRWSDPTLGIPWPVSEDEAIVLDRDRQAPLLSEFEAERTL